LSVADTILFHCIVKSFQGIVLLVLENLNEKNCTKTYSYNLAGKIAKSENCSGTREYSFDGMNRVTRQTFYRDNERSGFIDYAYDDRGNLIKKLHYWILTTGITELQTTTEYEFDDKNNPSIVYSSLLLPGLYTNTNNITKETYTIPFELDPSFEKVQITENSYRYN